MSKLYLFNHNNYFNKILKKVDTLNGYGTPIYTLSNTNFNYNDGVNTSHIINFNGEGGDYVVITDDNDNISSRWFVIDHVRTRGNQLQLELLRDLKVDLYDVYIDSPMIIHRGMISDKTNPLLFNSEGFSFNQIKKSEILLTDICAVPWYVLYFNDPNQTKNIQIQTTDLMPDIVISGTMDSLVGEYKYIEQCESIIRYQPGEAHDFHVNTFRMHMTDNNPMFEFLGALGLSDDYIWFDDEFQTVNPTLFNAFQNKYNNIKSRILTAEGISAGISTDLYAKYLTYNNKLIKDSNNNYYNVTVSVVNDNIDEKYYDEDIDNEYTTYCKSIIEGTGLERTGDWGDSFGIRIARKSITISATPYVDNDTITITDLFVSGTKVDTMDSDYRIIAIPADDFKVYTGENTYSTTPKQVFKKALKAIMMTFPKEELIDVQYLPYSPLQKELVNGGSRTYALDSKEVEVFASTGEVITRLPVFYIENANTSFDINYNLTIANYDDEEALDARAIDYKIASETTLYRLVSPNYNGVFEFNVAKNNEVNYFNVDMTLRPINPYIHINPNFKGLYGEDFNDARGLICQGDFSLPIHSDQFVEYEYRNKNYTNAFERQIEKLDFDQKQERIRAAFGLGAGATVGAIGGAVAGSKIGGVPGAIAGGLIGGFGSGIGGMIDYSMLESRQYQEKDIIIDNYRYTLGNVKALANNVSKITPLSYNNKIFPFIELYVCSDKELEIFKNYLKFNSMTIEAIDYLYNYVVPNELTFVSATLIRLDNAEIHTHELEQLRLELEKGVYM